MRVIAEDARRPDPDALLQVACDEAGPARGRLKIFFGASAGVGKTCAMLAAAQAARSQGLDVVVGVVESHGRAETEALVAGLERLPPRALAWQGRMQLEFDLDAALARRPALVLVDELAHSNAPGSRHPKRWNDVRELLDSGIGVWTTLNVQHLESLNDIVGGITGVQVRETVPDHVFDKADEVVIVDLSPDDLLQRLKEGKVYLPDQAERAVRNFFRKGNLIALRELALRRTADRVDDQMLAYRQRGTVPPVWTTRESLLACVGPGEHGEKTVRSTARLADQLAVPWHAVYVETPALERLASAPRAALLRTLKLAQDLGATTATLAGDNPAETIVRYARHHNLAKIVLGRTDRPRRWPWQRVLADHVGLLGADLDVLQIALGASRRAPSATGEAAAAHAEPVRWRDYAGSVAVCIATTLLATPLIGVLEPSNIVMLFLLAVLGVALRWGRGPAVLAAFLAVGSFDYFFVPPRFTLAVADVQYLVTFAVMLIVALVIGQMAAGLTWQARVAQRREERVSRLYAMSRDLSAALLPGQVREIGARFLAGELDARSALLLPDAGGRLNGPAVEVDVPDLDPAVAQWCYDRREPAGHGTDTLPAGPTLYLPLPAPMRVRGVLAVQPRDATRLDVPEQRRLLETCASLLAISLERIHYVDVAQDTTVQIASERLRNSLLAAISHDLRTPLAALVALTETMAMTRPPLAGPQAETARAIKDSAVRMSALVDNLLDMARLESGAVQLNRQWQPLEEVVGAALQEAATVLGPRSVHVDLAPDVPLVEIDAVLIERVLVNLLENAAKYTPAGSPIEITAVAGADSVALRVDDHGPGVPRGREEAMFRKFERGDKESATPGVGLGLAIGRSIAEAHGGTLEATNREDGGARFVLTLPRGTPPRIDLLPEVAA